MLNKGTVLLMGFLALGASAPVQADQTIIQGVEHDGRGYTLPRVLCADHRMSLRLGAMVSDPYDRPVVPPAEAIHWTVVQENGNRIDWSPRQSPSYGPFRRDPQFGRAIRLAMPQYRGFDLDLVSQARGARGVRIRVVDANGPMGRNCQWGPQGMYVNGPYSADAAQE